MFTSGYEISVFLLLRVQNRFATIHEERTEYPKNIQPVNVLPHRFVLI